MRGLYFSLSCLLALSTVACGGENSPELQQTHAKVINGSPLGDEFPEATKLYIRKPDSWTLCSAVWIGEQHLLTAAHCLVEKRGRVVDAFSVISPDQENEESDVYLRASSIIVHPEYSASPWVRSAAFPSLRAPAYDLAVIRFATANRKSFATLTETPPKAEDSLVFVGFGKGSSREENAGTGQIGITTLEAVDPYRVFWRFDGSESNTCSGDSGGPGYIDSGKGLKLLTITSGGTDLDCTPGDLAFNTRLDTVAAWISEVTNGDVRYLDD